MSLTTEGAARIQSLDVMRGFAVLGILIVNATYFAATWHSAIMPNVGALAVDQTTLWSWLVMHVFFEFKCITLFSMLFGVSLYLVGGERSDKDRGAQLRRRLGWMVLFGLIHGALIWYGDILLSYALTGFLVLLARSWRARTLMIVGVGLTLLSSALIALMMLAMQHAPPEALQEQTAAFDLTPDEFAAMRAAITGDALSSLQQNFSWWTIFFLQSLTFIIPRTAGVMMIGLALFKWGFLSGRSPLWIYWLMLALGAGSFALTWMESLRAFEAGFPPRMMQGEDVLVLSLLSPFGTLAYMSAFILLLKANLFGFLLQAFAATGRMAFTNYIAQSLIMTTIFWRLDWFGQLSRPELIGVVAIVWVVQLIWSPLWLSMFAMGPLEWVWRCLTYKKLVPFLKQRQQPQAA